MIDKNIYICHHDDDDGIMAGSIFKYYFGTVARMYKYSGMLNINCVELNYEMQLDKISILNNITENDIVIFVDYSLSNKAIENIAFFKHLIDNIKCRLIWIDHHASSVDTIQILENRWMRNIEGAISTKYCGAMLSYWYILENFMTNKPNSDIIKTGEHLADIIDSYYDNTPIVLKYIDDYDCWKHNFEHTKIFHTGLNLSYDSKDFIQNAIRYIYSETATDRGYELLDRILSTGMTVKPFDEKRNRIELKSAFECTIPGYEQYSVLACNSSTFSSLLFGDKINEYDILCVFRFTGDKFKYSLYTANQDIQVNKIAESFGGGGHPGAAGFNIPEFLFYKVD